MTRALLNSKVSICGRTIGQRHPPLIVAEFSGNHQQSLEKALKMVEAAAEAGVDAIKLQTYTADTMTMNVQNADFVIQDKDSLWSGQHLYDLYRKASTPWNWHAQLFQKAEELGMLAFSSPFDETAVDFLEELGVPCYKIASFECTDLPLIRKVASTKKPVIISTGMASLNEIRDSVKAFSEAGGRELILLKCTSTYPAPPGHCNLATIPHLATTFSCPVGLSDHTNGIGIALGAVGLGASVIEKHFVLDATDGGLDACFSIEPAELALLVAETRKLHQAIGSINYGETKSDLGAKIYRRSIYVAEDLEAGQVLTEKNIRIVRPGFGLPPKDIDSVVGMKVCRSVKKGTPVVWELLQCD